MKVLAVTQNEGKESIIWFKGVGSSVYMWELHLIKTFEK